MPVAEIGNHLDLAVLVMKLLLVGLSIENVDAVPVKIGKSGFLFLVQLNSAEFFIAEIIYTYNKSGRFLVKQYR